MIKYWPLIKKLALSEIKSRYTQSFLGYFWVILNPFFQMLIMSFVFSNILGRVGTLGVPYSIFLYAGLLPWTFFISTVTSAMSELSGSASLIKKIYFPREILIISTIMAKTVDFFLSTLIFVAMMILFQMDFHLNMLLFFPIFMIQTIFIFGLSLLLSAMNLFYRDVQYLMSLVLRLWFYVTPIIYAVEFFPEQYRWIFKINPMSVFINAYRQVLFTNSPPSWTGLAVGTTISILIFVASYRIFKKLEGVFADVV